MEALNNSGERCVDVVNVTALGFLTPIGKQNVYCISKIRGIQYHAGGGGFRGINVSLEAAKWLKFLVVSS